MPVTTTPRYNKYRIKETDQFDANDFPKIQLELHEILNATKGIPALHMEDMVVGFLRDHSLEQEWIDSNAKLTVLLTGGNLTITHLEGLFDSARTNKDFLRGYELYIRETLASAEAK